MIDSNTTQLIAIIFFLLTLFVVAVLSRRRRQPFPVRRIAAYTLMPSFVGLSIESNQPLHVSLGSVGVGGESTLLAIASAEIAYRMAQRATIGDVSPILTLSDASALPLGQDSLRRAYQSRGFSERYRPNSVRWYPDGGRSMAFAAALSAMIADERVSANVFAGSFGPELSLMAYASQQRDLPMIAVSNQLDGQAVAFAMSDEPLIGEEIFLANAYLGTEDSPTTEAIIVDVLRWIVVLALLVGFIITLIGNGG